MDFLGLSNLTIIDQTIKMIQKKTGEFLDLDTIPKDDAKTFELLSQASRSSIHNSPRRFFPIILLSLTFPPHIVSSLALLS